MVIRRFDRFVQRRVFFSSKPDQVFWLRTAFDALAKISKSPPDVYSWTFLMPRLDGYPTCALIKKNAHFAGRRDHALLEGGLFDRRAPDWWVRTSTLTKPFTKDSLLKNVARTRLYGT